MKIFTPILYPILVSLFPKYKYGEQEDVEEDIETWKEKTMTKRNFSAGHND